MGFHFSEVTIRSLIPKLLQEHRNIRSGLCCGGHLDGLSYSLGNAFVLPPILTKVTMMELNAIMSWHCLLHKCSQSFLQYGREQHVACCMGVCIVYCL